jgi:hypothetical protein
MSDIRRPKPIHDDDPDEGDSAASDFDAGHAPAPRATTTTALGTAPVGGSADALARELAGNFREHVRRALGIDLDGSITSLAFVDHYLRTARSESRAPIVGLVAAEAGAYYGELVRAEIGASWIGDGNDPRRLRLLMRHQFLYCAPVDQALEALLGPVGDDDDRLPEDEALDTAFHARKGAPPGEPDDASWLADRLAELPAVSELEFYTLTCRFETLQLALELLAAKHAGAGENPREYQLRDYVDALS